MVCTNHGSLPIAALLGGSPPPYPFVTGDLYFLPKIWSTSVVLGTDPFVDCSKGAVAVSLGQKVVLSFNGYWGKRSGYSLAKPDESTQFG